MEEIKEGYISDYISGIQVKETPEEIEATQVFSKILVEDYEYAKQKGITQEYLFMALSIKEIGYYEAIRRTVVASTIPHLRPERMKDMIIPIVSKEKIEQITKCVSEAFNYKNQRIPLLKENDDIIENTFI